MKAVEVLQKIRHSIHELAQPLSAVTGLVDLLLLEFAYDEALHRDISLLRQQLQRVIDLTADLRQLTRELSSAD